MVAANVEEVRGRDLDRFGHQRLAHHGCLRRSHRGFEQRFIANSGCAPMSGEHFAVNRLDRLDSEMLERLAQERRLKSAAFFLISRLAVRAAVSESIAG